MSLAADAGAFAALGGEDVGVAGVGVAPTQVGVEPAGQDRVFGWLELPIAKVRKGPNWVLSGSPGALPRRSPLRTGRARFQATGSSKP